MTAVPFPILRLPRIVLQKSLKLMNLIEQLSLSVLSKTTKQLVKSVQVDPKMLSLSIEPTIVITLIIEFFEHWTIVFAPSLSLIETHIYSRISGFTKQVLYRPRFNWLEHISEVFCGRRSVELIIEDSKSLDEVCDYARQFRVVGMRIETLEDHQFLERFPFLEDLAISNAPSAHSLESVLTPGFKKLELDGIKVALNDILVSNSSVFSIQQTHLHLISDEDINIFMKHWIKGSHPHLKELQITFRRVSQNHLVESVFLKGIDYIETMGHGSRRKFEIQRHDGTNAIVTINAGNYIFFGLTAV